jgi:hypothetical protein
MDYLALKSARAIMKLVAANDGLLTWYNIVKTVDQEEDIERVPPTFFVLKELTRLGYLCADPPLNVNHAKYSITEDGRAFIR